MRSRPLPLALATIVTLTGCARAGLNPPSTVVPAAVNCIDAPQLRQRPSMIGSRVMRQKAIRQDRDGQPRGLLCALAEIADLTCKVKTS